MNQPRNEDSNLSIPEKSTGSKDRRNWTSSRLGKVTAGAVLALEVNPLSNEALRLAALGATLGATHDPVLAAAVYGTSTLAIEGAGGIVTADVLDTPTAVNLVDKSNKLLNKLGASKIPKMNKPTEAAIAMVAGTPAVTILKHRESPERTRQENRRYATIVSLGISAVTAVQGLALAEGIHSPSPETISLAALGVGSFLASWKWARNRLRKADEPDKEQNNVNLSKDSKFYLESFNNPQGPQKEGFSSPDLEKVMADPNTHFIEIPSGEETYKWPILTPIVNFSEYVPRYFKDRYGSVEKVYYLSLPPGLIEGQYVGSDLDYEVADFLAKSAENDLTIVFDELTGTDTLGRLQRILAKAGSELSIWPDSFTDSKNNTPAANIHFVGNGLLVKPEKTVSGRNVQSLRAAYRQMVSEGLIKPETGNETILLEPSLLDLPHKDGRSTIERLWEIYDKQFSKLIENHPARGAQTYEELKTMAQDPNTLTIARLADNEIVSFAMFVGDINACDWLNANFYKDRFPNDLVLYFPGIASDMEKSGMRYSPSLVHLIVKLLHRATDDVKIVFQCTNISAEYIPKIVERAVESTGLGEIEFEEMLRYNFTGFKVKRAQSGTS